MQTNKMLRSRCRTSSEGGFSLVEVLMALMLFGICVTGLLTVLSQTTDLLLHTKLKETARNLATAQLEYLKSSEVAYDAETVDVAYSPKPELDAEYGLVTEVTEVQRLHAGNPDPPPADDEGVQKITLTVSQGADILATLEGYKAKWDD